MLWDFTYFYIEKEGSWFHYCGKKFWEVEKMKIGLKKFKKLRNVLAVGLTAVLAVGTFQLAPNMRTTAKAAGNAENFTMMLDDIVKGDIVATGDYKFGDSVLTLVGKGAEQYTVKAGKTVTVNGKVYNSYTAGKRHNDSNNIPTIPKAGDGTLTIFTPAAKGTLTVYFNTTSFLRVHDYNTSDGSKIGYKDTKTGITSYTFEVLPGHTYVMSTTGKTNNMFYAGYKYIVDKIVSTPIEINNVDAKISDSLEISVVDAELGGNPVKLTNGSNAEFLEGHTYKLSTNDGGVKATVNDSDTFLATGEGLVISLYDVPDVAIEGKITGTPAGTVTELVFENMVNGFKYNAQVAGDSYTCNLKPGEYNTSVVTTNGGITHDRVSVKSEGNNVNEVYVELPATETEAVPFKSEINVPGDYDSLNDASDAILNMKDRPEGEAGRVTINLTDDIFEQTVMAASYVTLKGNDHMISWYYGVGTLYYSVDPKTGLYNETLARDKYTFAEGNGSLWGGVFIVRGDNFIAEDTTFKNTYNYELTEAEKTDIAGTTLSVSRLADGADVTSYAYKERSNAFYIEADNIECYNCKILSSQDTLGRNGSANNNYHTYFRDCVIGGNTDYICGEFAAIFDNCELQWKSFKDTENKAEENNAKVGYIVAPKTSPYVFRDCKVTTDGVGTGVTGYYGRTWGANSNCSFIRTQTNGYIKAEGWGEMNIGDGETAVFKEYANLSGEETFVSNGAFSKADNQTEDSVASYVESEKNSAIGPVLNGWVPTHYVMRFDADYTGIQKALERAGNIADATIYVDFEPVMAAAEMAQKCKFEKKYKIDQQAIVDSIAKALNDAIDALVLKDADYTNVNAALAKADKLTVSEYKDFSAVKAAVDAVVKDLKITEQSKVDAMAKAITDAIDALEKKSEESNKDTTDDENEKTEVTGDAASSVVDTAISEDAEIKNAVGETVDSSEVKVQVKTSSEETIAEIKELIKKNEIIVSENAVTKFFDIDLVDGSGTVVKLSNGKVRITLAKDDSIDYSKVDVLVYHIKDDGSVEKMDVTVTDGKVTFDTTSFSPFMVVYEPKADVATGDSSAVAMYALLALMAVLAMMGMVYADKKRRA